MLNGLMDIVVGNGSYWMGQEKSPNNFYFDNFGEPLIYALIGFAVVFVGIVIIIAVIWLIGLLMRKTNNLEFLTRKKVKKSKRQPNEQTNEALNKVSSGNDDEIPDEVKVAIMAAIMAYYQENQPKCQFTVKRIKRI